MVQKNFQNSLRLRLRFWSGVVSGVEYYEIFKAKMHATLNSNMFVEILQCSGENYINTYAFNWYCMNLKILNKIHFNETDNIQLGLSDFNT